MLACGNSGQSDLMQVSNVPATLSCCLKPKAGVSLVHRAAPRGQATKAQHLSKVVSLGMAVDLPCQLSAKGCVCILQGVGSSGGGMGASRGSSGNLSNGNYSKSQMEASAAGKDSFFAQRMAVRFLR